MGQSACKLGGMTVKNKIKQFLDNKGITPYRFRADTGIAPSTAYDLYNNPDRLPNSNVLTKICDAYEIQPGEVLEWVRGGALTSDRLTKGS